MTVPLSPGSPRAVHALRFGAELDRAMRTRKTGAIRLSEAVGCAKSAIANWRAGGNLPRLDTAQRLAEALEWPRLAEISRAGRSGSCRRCGRAYVNQGGSPKVYCSAVCASVDGQLRKPAAGAVLAAAVRAEASRPRARKAPLLEALALYGRAESRRVRRVDMQAGETAMLRGAVDAMCAGCEPEGLCRDTACPLRTFSPLPVAGARPGPVPPRMTDTPEGRAESSARRSGAPGRRWEDPEARERQSAQNTARWASKSDQERQEIGMRISAGRRAAAS